MTDQRAWRDIDGDVWIDEGGERLYSHTEPEGVFRKYVEKKWGPLVELVPAKVNNIDGAEVVAHPTPSQAIAKGIQRFVSPQAAEQAVMKEAIAEVAKAVAEEIACMPPEWRRE